MDEAADAIVQNRKRFTNLPYDYGYKLHFYAQRLLVILVAEGLANVRKVRKGYRYVIVS